MPGGELNGRQKFEIDRAIRAAEQECRFEFSVFVGASEGPPAAYATRLHASLKIPARSVLVLVDPQVRALEIVTGSQVRRVLRDAEVELAAMEMRSSIAEGDLVGGLVHGIAMLAAHARAPRTLHAD